MPLRSPLPTKPLLCGYYGEHNLGDDALLAVLLGQLPPGQFQAGGIRQPLDQHLLQAQFSAAARYCSHQGCQSQSPAQTPLQGNFHLLAGKGAMTIGRPQA